MAIKSCTPLTLQESTIASPGKPSSSALAALSSAEVTIARPSAAEPLDRHSTLAEWLDHPVGHEVVLKALRRAPGGDLSSLVEDPERLRMLGSFPLKRLAGMLGMGDGTAVADALLAEVQG